MRAGTDRPQAGGNLLGLFSPRRPVKPPGILPPVPVAGENYIEIQRPSAFQSDPAYLNATSLKAQHNGKSKLAFGRWSFCLWLEAKANHLRPFSPPRHFERTV